MVVLSKIHQNFLLKQQHTLFGVYVIKGCVSVAFCLEYITTTEQAESASWGRFVVVESSLP